MAFLPACTANMINIRANHHHGATTGFVPDNVQLPPSSSTPSSLNSQTVTSTGIEDMLLLLARNAAIQLRRAVHQQQGLQHQHHQHQGLPSLPLPPRSFEVGGRSVPSYEDRRRNLIETRLDIIASALSIINGEDDGEPTTTTATTAATTTDSESETKEE